MFLMQLNNREWKLGEYRSKTGTRCRRQNYPPQNYREILTHASNEQIEQNNMHVLKNIISGRGITFYFLPEINKIN